MAHKIALIGFGGMAGWHYEKIQEIDELEVAGIWDIKEERRTVAQSRNIHVYQGLDDLLADKQTDLVLVATPNDVHKELVIAEGVEKKDVARAAESLVGYVFDWLDTVYEAFEEEFGEGDFDEDEE